MRSKGGATAPGQLSPREPPGEVDDESEHRQWTEAMRALLHAVDHAWQALAVGSGMSINDVVVLALLHSREQVSTTALRARTGLSASAVTSLVDRLEHRDLARRVRPRHNRRLVLVELTDHGRDRASALFGPLLGALDDFAAAGAAPPLAQQLPTIRHLVSLFEHAALAAPPSQPRRAPGQPT